MILIELSLQKLIPVDMNTWRFDSKHNNIIDANLTITIYIKPIGHGSHAVFDSVFCLICCI